MYNTLSRNLYTVLQACAYNLMAMIPMELYDVQSELSPTQQQVVLDTLRSILDSAHFSKSPRSRALLEFAVRNALQGNSGSFKERTVGIEVFGRSVDYDTNSDPVVRTAAVEVRRRIVQYFSEHPATPVRIDIPAGSYKAAIHFRSQHENQISHLDTQALASNDARNGYSQPVVPDVLRGQENASLSTTTRKVRTHLWNIRAAVGIAAMLAVVVTGIGLWRSQRDRGLREFWGPVLKSGEQPLILIGRTNQAGADDGQAATGAFNASGFRSLVLDDAIAAAQVCGVFRQYGRECKIDAVQVTGGEEISNRSIVVIGGLGSPWGQQILAPLLYYPRLATVTQPAAQGVVEIMKRQPTGDIPLWTFNRYEAPAQFGKDYAIIARYRNAITGSMTVVLAGLGFRGTNSAGQFISSPDKLRDLLSRAPKGWKGTNFEAVLQIDLVQGTSSNAEVIATNFW